MDAFSVSSQVLFVGFIQVLLHMDSNVIHEHRCVPFCYVWAEYCVHHHLECRRGVGEAKEHNRGFE